MIEMLLAVSPLLAVFLLIAARSSRRACPDCGAALPTFMSPLKKTRRIWLTGGCVCSQCGCETDESGRKVTPATPTGTVPMGWMATALGAAVLGAALLGWVAYSTPAAPPAVAQTATAVVSAQ